MTTHIHRGDLFLGYPVTKLKTFLQLCFNEGGFNHPEYLSERRSLDLSEGACAAFLSECQDRGFFEMRVPDRNAGEGDDSWKTKTLHLSRRGEAILHASARKRASKEKARSILDTMVANAEKVLNDPLAPMRVDEIWVLGSFINEDKSDVGDLDVVVTHAYTKCGRGNPYKVREYIDDHYPGVLAESVDSIYGATTWLTRMIFGKRRDALIHDVRFSDLIALHCPCWLVFDAKRGGGIRPEKFPFHPKSERKEDTIKERAVMPILNDVAPVFTPTPVSVLDGDRFRSVILYGSAKDLPESVIEFSQDTEVDGRFSAIACQMEGSAPQVCFAIKRGLECGALEWRYTMDIRATYVSKSFTMYDDTARTFARALGVLRDADMLRIANRRSLLHGFPAIELDVRLCNRSHRMESFVREMKSVTCGFTKDLSRSLPTGFSTGIGFLWEDEEEWAYLAPFEWDEEDWNASNIDRSTYEKWRRKAGRRRGLHGIPATR